MLYNDHFDELKSRMMAYWERDEVDRCSIALMVKRPDARQYAGGNYYYDTVKADYMSRLRFESLDYLWEAIPAYLPYFGTGLAEYAGAQAEYAPNTVWFHPCMEEPDIDAVAFKCPEVFERQKAAMADLVELAHKDYAVTVTDNCGIADALSCMRGAEELLMDMLTEEDFVMEAIQKLIGIYKETQEQFFKVVKENNEGSIH